MAIGQLACEALSQFGPALPNWLSALHLPSRIAALNSLGVQASIEGQHCRAWGSLHVSPPRAPPKGAKLCTCFAWVFRPAQMRFQPKLDIAMPITRLRVLMQFRMGSHCLSAEQGRLARPILPRHLRQCTLYSTHAIGDEQHCVFDCPAILHTLVGGQVTGC